MPENDDLEIALFGYDLTGSVIEQIVLHEKDLDIYLSTHRMNIPDDVPIYRDDGCYLLTFRNVKSIRSDFPWNKELAERLATEGNEIHDYGFSDENLVEGQTANAIEVYFDTDWGLLEIAALSITYSV